MDLTSRPTVSAAPGHDEVIDRLWSGSGSNSATTAPISIILDVFSKAPDRLVAFLDSLRDEIMV